MIKIVFFIVSLLSAGGFFIACSYSDDDETFFPKPKAYPRIDFPIKSYKIYDSICPYSFEIPVYSHIEKDKHPSAEPCWINVDFPKFNAQIHISYKTVINNLDTFLNDSRDFAIKHQIKATGLDETVIVRDSARVYGLVYDIRGNTASNIQFYLTDSTHHFMRGALYFNTVPNIDSLSIVIDYLRQDIIHLIKTFKWKDPSKQKQR